ncbi:MAG: arginine--tRNA ligase [archaeon]|jgi:arginyl-tRNA synthetase|nr:arginine--tRNA ligase [archaeon]
MAVKNKKNPIKKKKMVKKTKTVKKTSKKAVKDKRKAVKKFKVSKKVAKVNRKTVKKKVVKKKAVKKAKVSKKRLVKKAVKGKKKTTKKAPKKAVKQPEKEEILIPDPWMEAREEVVEAVKEVLKKLKLKPQVEIERTIEEPPSYKMGDLACSVSFPLGKLKRKSPREFAEKILANIKKPKSCSKVKLAGAYVNFFFKKDLFMGSVLKEAVKTDYGQNLPQEEKVMVEYSQANTHKAFHIGHLRGTSLGESLSRILRQSGYEVVQANYPGDVGAHVAKVLWCYRKFHEGEVPRESKGEWLGKLYTEACEKIEQYPDYKKEVEEVLRNLEDESDGDLMQLWNETKQWSINDFNKIYEDLDAHFDVWFFESQMEKPGKEIVQELLKEKIAKKSDGAIIINMEKPEKLGIFLILRSDGTALYSTKDLALAKTKFEDYGIDKSIYITGSEQRLHFQQLFNVLKKMKFKNADKCKHIPYDLVTLASGKMSSREGTSILYSEMKNRMFEKALEEVMLRNPDIDPRMQRKIALDISLGAMKFQMLNIGNNKTIFFDWERSLEFEGETGPYLQYATVRSMHILEDVKKFPDPAKVDMKVPNDEEYEIIKHLSKFPMAVREASKNYRPDIIANYSIHLAEKFNAFYAQHPVLKETDKDVRKARILLVQSVYNTLGRCLYLLGIRIPERM